MASSIEKLQEQQKKLKEFQKTLKNGTKVVATKVGYYDEGTGVYRRYRPGEEFQLWDDVNTDPITGEETIKPAGEFFSAKWMRLASDPEPVAKTKDSKVVPGGPKPYLKRGGRSKTKAEVLKEQKADEKKSKGGDESPL